VRNERYIKILVKEAKVLGKFIGVYVTFNWLKLESSGRLS
jgi:hypothetical protein